MAEIKKILGTSQVLQKHHSRTIYEIGGDLPLLTFYSIKREYKRRITKTMKKNKQEVGKG
jgi:hypothetical protein